MGVGARRCLGLVGKGRKIRRGYSSAVPLHPIWSTDLRRTISSGSQSAIEKSLWYTDFAMATKTPSETGTPPQDAPDGDTGQINLIQKPALEPTILVRPAVDAQPDDKTIELDSADEVATEEAPGDTEVLFQETKPMDAVAWPPPEAVHDVPTRPPPLRYRESSEQITSGANRLPVSAPHGVLTTELRRALPTWALPLLTAQPVSVWIAARIGISLLALLATMMIPAIAAQGTANWYGSPGGPSLTPIVDGIGGVWTRWDGQWYLKIAAEGYSVNDGSSAFFPLYPWMVAVFGWLAGGRFIWAGIVLSSLFFLAALVLLHRLVRFDFHHEDAGRAVFYLAAFPMAFFFWAVYSESLFLFLSVAALLAMRSQRWWWAALAISFAIWTRTTGLLLLLPFAWELWRAYHPPIPKDPRAMPPKVPSRWVLPSLSLPFGALFLFILWSWLVFRDPLAPISAQADWNRHFSWPWQTIAGAWNVATQAGLQFQPESQAWTYLGSFVVAVAVGALALRWLRPSFSIYLWAGILFPLFSATPHNPLLSYPRFLLVLFPAFMVLALIGRNRYAHQIITWASLLLLALYTIRFVNWYWVA